MVDKKHMWLVLPFLGKQSLVTKHKLLKFFGILYLSKGSVSRIYFHLKTKFLNICCLTIYTNLSVQDATPVM